jgi:hypothetical protein
LAHRGHDGSAAFSLGDKQDILVLYLSTSYED